MRKYLKKKIFGVKVQGWITVSIVLLLASMVGVVPNALVVPVSKSANWVMFYAKDMDRWQLHSGVAEDDFENQGWNVIQRVGVEDGSFAADGWTKFARDYGTNPAICLIDTGQTPIYTEGPKYWGDLIHTDNNAPGTMGYVYKGDMWINGNAKKYDSDEYNLIKFGTHQGRTVIIVWTSIRFDSGQLQGYVLAWRWVAVYGAFHEKNWYILDNRGNIIDSQIIATDPAEDNGENPEDNPLLDGGGTDPETGEPIDYTDEDEPIADVGVEDPEVVEAREQQAILVMVGLIGVLIALGGFTLYLGKKMKLF